MSNFLQWSLFNERVDLDECLSDLLMVELWATRYKHFNPHK
jgi:hypothetical protein